MYVFVLLTLLFAVCLCGLSFQLLLLFYCLNVYLSLCTCVMTIGSNTISCDQYIRLTLATYSAKGKVFAPATRTVTYLFGVAKVIEGVSCI